MAIDFDTFYEWAKDRFGEQNLKIKNTPHGTEICTHSLWSERAIGKIDTKYHLWMNPSGGKSKNPENGSYRCWLTDHMGSLVQLVSEVDHIDYEEAENLIGGTSTLRMLEKKVHEFFGHKEKAIEVPAQPVKKLVELPPSTFLISSMLPDHHMRIRAEEYLRSRKIPIDGMYVCVAGDLRNRIVIPYYNRENELIWYNTRLMDDGKDVLRYIKCDDKEASQDDVLFMTGWPRAGAKIYIVEGEFDAMSFKGCGLFGCACGGKVMSETQIEMLRPYVPVLAFDADESGLNALINIGNQMLERGFSYVGYVRPPKAAKDWNKLLVDRDPEIMKSYLNRCEKSYTSVTPALLLSNKI